MSKATLPPGPSGLPVLGSAIPFFRDILGFLNDTAEKYGDIAYFRLGGRKIYMLNHPDDIQDVLVTNNRNFLKSRALQRAKLVVGEGLLTSEKETHLANRRVIQPIFHNKVIPEFADTMVGIANEYVSNWKENEVFDVHRNMMEMTQQIVVKTLFDTGIEDSAKLIDSLSFILNQFPRFLFPFSELLDKLPLPNNSKCYKALDTIDEALYRIIEERKGSDTERFDLLSLLIGDGNEFDEKQVRDELITFYIAGQETTSNSLCWTLYLLSKHTVIRDAVNREVADVLGGRLPGYEDVNKLSYTGKVVKESLRMYPPAWVVTRRAIEDYNVRGYTIPAGADIYMSQNVVHYDERFYEEPRKFNPDRWTNSENDLPRFAYFPFGGGPRRCIGEPFAIMEAVLIIAVIASKWKLNLAPGFKVEAKPLITLRPKKGLRMIPVGI